MNGKKGFSILTDLTSDVKSAHELNKGLVPVQERETPKANHSHASRELPGENSKYFQKEYDDTGSGEIFSGVVKILRSIPWQLYLVVAVVGYFFFQSGIEDRQISSFQKKIGYYLARNNDSGNVPALVPGVITIDIEAKTVDKMLFKIKDTFKTKSAKDVSFVVGFNCSDMEVGKYSDGAKGYQKSCKIYVIDVRSHTWSYAGNFIGSEPPGSKKGSGSRTGSHPVQDYLIRVGVM
jgi:hypothetical protein